MPDQHINYAIKTVGELAEINELVSTTKTKGGFKISTQSPKHDLIKTHTARRSFVQMPICLELISLI